MAKKLQPARAMVDEVFALARQLGWTNLNDHELQLIELLRNTTWHGRNLVMETAIAMRSAHPWLYTTDSARAKTNTAVIHPADDKRFIGPEA